MSEPTALPQFQGVRIPMEQIYSDADFNCRGKIVPFDVLDLAKSIADMGLQQPILLQPHTRSDNPLIKYRIIAGHRRHMAYVINKQKEIPAFVREGMDEMTARLYNLTENLKREDLNILQEARALVPFKKAGWQQETIAIKTGTSRGWVQVRMMLLELPEDIQAQAAAGILTQAQIRQLYSMPGNDERYAAVRLIKERKEKGESTELPKRRAIKPHEKRERDVGEVIILQEYIQDAVGNSIVTRVLGWVGGYVSPLEIHRELREYFKAQGKEYPIPKEILSNM